MTLNGKTKGAIIGTAMVVGAATGGVWASGPPPADTSQAYHCDTAHPVFAGRAGALPRCPATGQDKAARRVVGSTVTGCVLGFLTKGGLWGCFYGGIGGAVSQVPWGDIGG
jgi:hypothetical protein